MVFVVFVLFVLATAFAAPLDVSIARMFGGGGSSTTLGNAISVLSSGKVVLSGYTNGNVGSTPTGVTEGVAQGFATDGTVLWTKQVTTGAGGNLQFWASAIDSSDNTYVVARCSGSFYGVSTAGDFDVCFVKLDSAGNLLASFLNGGTGLDQAWQIAVNKADGSIYIVGGTVSSTWNGQTKTGTADAFVLKISVTGSTSTLLATKLFGVAGQDTFFLAVTVDSTGNTWAVGYTKGASYAGVTNAGAVGTADVLIQKMNPSGTVLFSTLIGGPGADLGE